MIIRKFTLASTILLIMVSWNGPRPVSLGKNEKTDSLFQSQLNYLLEEIYHLKSFCDHPASLPVLKNQFRQTRLAYKKSSILCDYFYPYQRKLINGPDLLYTEEDNPQHIISPAGFQVIERMIFSNDSSIPYHLILKETEALERHFISFRNQPNLANKFQKERITEAVKSGLIRVITQGITGFDSPLALHSIPEARASLEGIKDILSLNVYPSGVYVDSISGLLTESINYLYNKDFIEFDRLYFIKKYADPLYRFIVKAAIEEKIRLPRERRPVNEYANSIFSEDFFNISFFSPNQRYQATAERIALGKKLFYAPVFGQNNQSCATCHQPDRAFSDGLPKALSADKKSNADRNTPTLWNAALQTRYFYDSRTATLENQLNDVVHSVREMKGSLIGTINRLQQEEEYRLLFNQAYPNDPQSITEYNISNAVSSYIRSLVSFNSRFDRYMRSEKDAPFKQQQKKGFNLFMGKARCGTCHFMPLFNGLVPPEFTDTESEVLAVPSSGKKKSVIDPDQGKYLFTGSSLHQFAFKTPTLRNIALTAPYMHNGIYNTLEEVIEFYNEGGGTALGIAPKNQTLPAEKLHLSKKEIKALIAFMQTLTDTSSTYHHPPM